MAKKKKTAKRKKASAPKKKSTRKKTTARETKKPTVRVKPSKRKIPAGFELLRTLRGHETPISAIAWSPDGRTLASGSEDTTIRLWDAQNAELKQTLKGHGGSVSCVSWSPDGTALASGSGDGTIRVWGRATGEVRHTLKGHGDRVHSVQWSPDGKTLASGSFDGTIRLWDTDGGEVRHTLKGDGNLVLTVSYSPDGKTLASGFFDRTIRLWDTASGEQRRSLDGHSDIVETVSYSPDGRTLASGSADRTIRVWDTDSGRKLRVLEGHTAYVLAVRYSPDGRLLVSKSMDDTVRLWRTDMGVTLAILDEPADNEGGGPAFHPTEPILATLGESERGQDTVIRLWRLDYDLLLGQERPTDSRHYRNAKAVLIGDTSVGKSGLALVLTGRGYQATDSSDGRHVWTFDTHEETITGVGKETRETLLWDLAGQSGYRLIHQLQLNEVAVALVVFDARSETDPLGGVRHWDRALRLARQRQGDAAVPLRKFLVVGRSDRGGVSVSPKRIKATVREMDFDGYFETSAREGWKIPELRAAIRDAIKWETLPKVTSTKLFERIKQFLLKEKKAGRLLVKADDLYRAFSRAHRQPAGADDLRAEFDTCVSRLENRDLIRRLTFGGYVLLQPELLDAYASAIINAAKKEPDGLGSIAEEDAQVGRFKMSKDARIKDKKQERLILLATVEELVQHDLALREQADDGTYLVFPSQFVRDWPDAPEPKGKAAAYEFQGPVQSVYATLAVRLAHSGSFVTQRSFMWRNAAIYAAEAGGKCGIYLRDFAEGQGELSVFFDGVDEQTRFQFEEYVSAHLERRALSDSIKVTRSFVCGSCGTTVPDVYAAGRVKKGLDWIECGVCLQRVSLIDPRAELGEKYPSRVTEMDGEADERRDRAAAVMTLRGKVASKDYDVFLCHNTRDKPAVKKIGEALMERGILPWLDEWALLAGDAWQRELEKQIKKIKSTAVFIGPKGRGPWQNMELDAVLREFVKRKCPVIPVILADCKREPKLPVFLAGFHFVDFRKTESDPLTQLIRGIRRERGGRLEGRR